MSDIAPYFLIFVVWESRSVSRLDYGFKIGLMLKDVRIAVDICGDESEYFRLTERCLEQAVAEFGYDADYTRVAEVLENYTPHDLEDPRWQDVISKA